MSRISEAAAFAAGAHQGQRYGAGADYVVHLAAVEGVLRRFGVDDEDLLVAAWLHDTLEDTKTAPFTIGERFGSGVLRLVFAVTNEPGANRKERHEKTSPKTRAAGLKAIVLKLADRIANIEASLQDLGGGKVGMYRAEKDTFRQLLGGNDLLPVPEGQQDLYYTSREMWAHLDALFERILVAKVKLPTNPMPCCFCWEKTDRWTLNDKNITGKYSIPCCETCASKNGRSKLPTYEQWDAEYFDRQTLARVAKGPEYLRPVSETLDRITKLQQALLPFAQSKSTDQDIDQARTLLGLSPRAR